MTSNYGHNMGHEEDIAKVAAKLQRDFATQLVREVGADFVLGPITIP